MTDEPVPIAYAALQPGTPVQSRDGAQIGVVESVLVVEEVDVFDGILVETPAGTRFVDADQVDAIFVEYVRTRLSPEEAAELPLPSETPVYGVDANQDTGKSVSERFGRWFGRGEWKQEK